MKTHKFSNIFTNKNANNKNGKNNFFKIFNHTTKQPPLKLIIFLTFFITIPLKNSFNSISIILLCIYSILHSKKSNVKNLSKFLSLYLFYALTIISLFYTTDFREGIKYITLSLSYLILPFVFTIIPFTKKEIQTILKIYIYWLCVLVLYSEIQTVINILNKNESLFLIFRKDYSYINLGQIIGIHPPYMVLQLAFCIIYLILNYRETGINKKVTVGIIFLMLFYSVHLSSRLPLAAITAISIFLVFKKLKGLLNIYKASLITLITVITLAFVFYNVRATRYRFQELFGMQYANGVYIQSGESKLHQWFAGLQANQNILFGNGIGDANESIIESNQKNGLFHFAELKYNAHNQYIQTYVGLGLLGLIVLILFHLHYFYISPKNFLRTTSHMFLIYIGIVYMTESYLERHHGLVYITFIMCFVNYKQSRLNST